MAERVTVTIEPSHDVLTVRDAMEQVLDWFALLSTSVDDSDAVVWELVSASTNSPFTVEAEAVGRAGDLPESEVGEVARAQKLAFAAQLRSIVAGEFPAEWVGTSRAEIAAKLFKRTSNGIALNRITLDDTENAITLSADQAHATMEAFEERAVFNHDFRRHAELGSIEGNLVSIDSYWHKPAIRVKDRSTDLIVTCLVTPEMHEKIAATVSLDDVWQSRRVTVRGHIQYGATGKILRITSDDVQLAKLPRDISVDQLIDPSFTGGLTVVEYLDRLREGELG